MAACVAACANGVLDCGLVSQRSAVSGGVRRSGVVSLVNRGGVLVRRKGLGIGVQKLQGVKRWSAVSGRAKVVLEEVEVKVSPVEQMQNGNGGFTNGRALESSSSLNGTAVRASNGAVLETGNGSAMKSNNGSVSTNGAVNGLPTNGAAFVAVNPRLDSIGQEDPWFKKSKQAKVNCIPSSLCLPTSRRIC